MSMVCGTSRAEASCQRYRHENSAARAYDRAMSIQITRRDLFERVWAEPIQKLSKEYGLSDVGLAKVCRRYDIPIPPRGYWAKKQAGKRVSKPALPPEAPKGYGDRVRLPGPSATKVVEPVTVP